MLMIMDHEQEEARGSSPAHIVVLLDFIHTWIIRRGRQAPEHIVVLLAFTDMHGS
jgi:hypothetical protein